MHPSPYHETSPTKTGELPSVYAFTKRSNVAASLNASLDSKQRQSKGSLAPTPLRSNVVSVKRKQSMVYPGLSPQSPVPPSFTAEVKQMFEALPQIARVSPSKSLFRSSRRSKLPAKKQESRVSPLSFSNVYHDLSRHRRSIPREKLRAANELAAAQKYFEEFHLKSRNLIANYSLLIAEGVRHKRLDYSKSGYSL
jgi:hypothetical protein